MYIDSGLGRPRSDSRCRILASWVPRPHRQRRMASDILPLIGMPYSSSGACYMVGCNGLGSGVATGIGVDRAGAFGLSRTPSGLGRFHETLLDRTIFRQVRAGAREEDGCVVPSSSDVGFRFAFVIVVGAEQATKRYVAGLKECGDDWVEFGTRRCDIDFEEAKD